MREIKYRQKLKDAYVSSYGESFHYWGYIDGGFVSPVGLNVASEESEQLTGLQDKNGVDIYEGDIVSGFYYQVVGLIKWSEDDCAFITSSKNGGAMLGQNYMNNFTKIGNIHENKELLCES